MNGGILMISIPENINTIINEFVKNIKDLLGDRVKKIILYGSYARGDYNENSDIDIMILTDLSDDEIIKYRKKVRDFACDLEMENNYMISPLLRNIRNYEKRVDIVPFYNNIEKEGIVLYG